MIATRCSTHTLRATGSRLRRGTDDNADRAEAGKARTVEAEAQAAQDRAKIDEINAALADWQPGAQFAVR